MEDYGVFTNIVAHAGTIMAMGAAIGLAWRGRAKWEPSEEDVPKAPQKVAGLVSAVTIAVIWATLHHKEYLSLLTSLAIGLALAAVITLLVYIFLVAMLTHTQIKSEAENQVNKTNILGGFWLNEQTRHIIDQKRKNGEVPPTIGELFKAASYDPDRVWSHPSRALAKVCCVFCYLGLVTTGTIALASAAILVDVRINITDENEVAAMFHYPRYDDSTVALTEQCPTLIRPRMSIGKIFPNEWDGIMPFDFHHQYTFKAVLPTLFHLTSPAPKSRSGYPIKAHGNQIYCFAEDKRVSNLSLLFQVRKLDKDFNLC